MVCEKLYFGTKKIISRLSPIKFIYIHTFKFSYIEYYYFQNKRGFKTLSITEQKRNEMIEARICTYYINKAGCMNVGSDKYVCKPRRFSSFFSICVHDV
jgi:hypothetical protein